METVKHVGITALAVVIGLWIYDVLPALPGTTKS